MTINLPILIISFGFFFLENAYFGWNWKPQSDAEVICDGIGMLLTALAFLEWRTV